MEGMVTTRID